MLNAGCRVGEVLTDLRRNFLRIYIRPGNGGKLFCKHASGFFRTRGRMVCKRMHMSHTSSLLVLRCTLSVPLYTTTGGSAKWCLCRLFPLVDAIVRWSLVKRRAVDPSFCSTFYHLLIWKVKYPRFPSLSLAGKGTKSNGRHGRGGPATAGKVEVVPRTPQEGSWWSAAGTGKAYPAGSSGGRLPRRDSAACPAGRDCP